MNRNTIIIISLSSFLVGMLFLAIQQQWILFQSPRTFAHIQKMICQQMTKKNTSITILKNGSFYREQRFILWSVLLDEQIEQLVNAWLALLDEESLEVKKMNLQAVWVDSNGQQATISFDRSPFNKQWPIIKKWYLVESLFKTLKDNSILIGSIQLLVDHKQLVDAHLDFSKPWPLEGFIDKKDHL